MTRPFIYLDYNATTPVDPAVREAMLPFLADEFGNPSSGHASGRRSHAAVEAAREQVASLIGARAGEIVFTSGGSEANNLALKGWALPRLLAGQRPQLIISPVEHPAVLQPARFLERSEAGLAFAPVDASGRVDVAAVEVLLKQSPAPVLVSVMHSNNEVGTLQPIREIAAICRREGALLHSDAAQSVGKVPVNVRDLDVDLLSIAGHKLYAPKGIGALYIRSGIALEALIHGAGHERGLRAGTENVPYIVGLGKACALARGHGADEQRRLMDARDRLWRRLRESLDERITLNGHADERLPNTLNVSFAGVAGHALLDSASSVLASTGSACHSGTAAASPVLTAMGVDAAGQQGAVRLSVGRFTTPEEVDAAAATLVESYRALVSGS